ncbi:curli-like amyloid fiber formation chaperone CsgH [Salisaeta longa]|uniref:curli-like amyloid fiber formation chaperone CsgH n=1 Tax=Salisaeta longa TaxID=503170 RepID=UPI0003B56254|nr:curli-like amyloid fiber formation chaperone CsgH [Salisaeta longa]
MSHWRKRAWGLLLIFLVLTILGARFTSTHDICARVVFDGPPQQLSVYGVVSSPTPIPDSLEYRLVVRRTGPSGTVRSVQSGRFRVRPRPDTLGRVTINVAAHDRLTATLRILHNTQVVATDERQVRGSPP